MKASDLRLDEQHRYWAPGSATPLPGVTQILKAAGLVDTRWCPPWALARGSAVHKGVELYLLGTLDWTTVDERIKPFLDAAVQFCVDAKVTYEPGMVECKVYHQALGYAGRIDLLCNAFGQPALVDFKSGALGKIGLQTAGYELARRAEMGGAPRRRMGVQLRENGTYNKTDATDVQDYSDWQALVRLYHRYYSRKEFSDDAG